MVWTNSQHQCSSISFLSASASSIRAAMAELEHGDWPAITAAKEPTLEDGNRDKLDGEPTAAMSPPSASGQAAAGTEAHGLSPAGSGAGSSNDLVPSEAGAVEKKGRSIMDEILALKLQQKEARDKKLQVTRELRNAEKRRQRLKKKAKQLTDADLVEVLKLRDHFKGVGRKERDTANLGASIDDSETRSVASTSTQAVVPEESHGTTPKKKANSS